MSNLHETNNDDILTSVASFLDQVKPITTLRDDNVPSSKELSLEAQKLALLNLKVVKAAKRNMKLEWKTDDILIYPKKEGDTSDFSIILSEEICHSIHPDLIAVNITHVDDPNDLEITGNTGLYTGNVIYLGGVATEEHMDEQYAQWQEELQDSGFQPFSSSIPKDVPIKQTGYMFTVDGNSRKLLLVPLSDPRGQVMNVPPIAKVVRSRFTQRDLHFAKTIFTIARDRLQAP